MEKNINSRRGLWWTAFIVLAGGAALIALMYFTSPGPRAITGEMRRVAMGSVLIAGICIISATANRWLQR